MRRERGKRKLGEPRFFQTNEERGSKTFSSFFFGGSEMRRERRWKGSNRREKDEGGERGRLKRTGENHPEGKEKKRKRE